MTRWKGSKKRMEMTNYFQMPKWISWVLLVVTLVLAFLVFFSIGFVSFFVGFVQHLIVPEKPWRFGQALFLIGTSVVLPALFLARFYFVVAARAYSPRYATMGWTVSACYHAALTWLFLFYIPGTVEISGFAYQLPLSLISGAALCTSLYLLIWYPRLPHSPTVSG